MTLRYKKSHLHLLLWIGVLLLMIAAVLKWLGADEFFAVFVVLGVYTLILYGFRSSQHYLSIRNGVIKKSGIFGRSIPIDEIRHVKKQSGDLVIQGTRSEILVYTAFLDNDSLRRFERRLSEHSQSAIEVENEPLAG